MAGPVYDYIFRTRGEAPWTAEQVFTPQEQFNTWWACMLERAYMCINKNNGLPCICWPRLDADAVQVSMVSPESGWTEKEFNAWRRQQRREKKWSPDPPGEGIPNDPNLRIYLYKMEIANSSGICVEG